APAAALEVEFEVAAGVEERAESGDRGARQRGAAEIRMHQDAGGIEHPAQPSGLEEQRGFDPLDDSGESQLEPLRRGRLRPQGGQLPLHMDPDEVSSVYFDES